MFGIDPDCNWAYMNPGPHSNQEDSPLPTRIRFFVLLTIVALSFVAVPAMADILYDNGPRGPDSDAWTINFGFVVSNSFTLASNAAVTGFDFNAWLFPGDTLTSAELSITEGEFGGTTYFDQIVTFVQSECIENAFGYNVCRESSNFNGPNLDAGTYWVNLQNADVNTGDPIYWDENSGEGCTSPGCPSQASQNSVGTIPSESFTILGNTGTGTVPEPSTLLLLASGAAGIAGWYRRRV
jgi:hypothetical protein